jgi:hypothetical protein
MVEDQSRKLFGGKGTTKVMLEAIRFFFAADASESEITFGLCCDVLQARVDVLRLRMQYEFWLRGTVFTGPCNFLAVTVPRTIAGEITHYGGDEGYALAREAWVQPGISGEELMGSVMELDGFSLRALRAALEHLEARCLLSCAAGRWYVTGRNPLLLAIRGDNRYGVEVVRGGSFYWSRLFGLAA